MPETRGQPDWTGNFVAGWVAREAMDWRPEDFDVPAPVASVDDEPQAEPVAGQRRSRMTADRVRAVIADATGWDADDLDDIDFTDMDAVATIIAEDLTDPQEAYAALDAALDRPRLDPTERAAPGESSRSYVVREQAWREEHGLPRRRRKPTPNRSPERRRLERMRAKARRLGITVEEADAMTPRVRAMSSNHEASSHGIHDPTG